MNHQNQLETVLLFMIEIFKHSKMFTFDGIKKAMFV